MKKILYFTAIILIASTVACNNSTPEQSAPPATTTENTTKDTPPADQPEGMALMSKSDCGTCHNATSKVVGPSYKDIAAKYPNTPENIAKLTDAVIKGGSGVWGSVPMTPHSGLPKQDVEKMVSYILTMK